MKNSEIVRRTNVRLGITEEAYVQQTIPSWNTEGRPQKPKTGVVGFNLETKTLEIWNGATWLMLRMKRLT